MPVELTSLRGSSRVWKRDESDALAAAIEEKRDLANNRAPAYKVWTRAECERLTAAGLLDYEHLELIEGELIDKIGKNRSHIVTLLKVQSWLRDVFERDRVNAESPIDVAPRNNRFNDPEPDLIVWKRAGGAFCPSKPQPADLDLVVEISDATLRLDLKVKARLYARGGIPEYWVFDTNSRRLVAIVPLVPPAARP